MIDTGTVLGPATVTSAGDGCVEISYPSGETARARLALAVPYRPAPGDEVLVIAQESGAYVIGVLRGRGTTTLAVQGDLSIEATGTIRMAAPRLEFRAGRIVQRARDFFGWVSGIFQSKSRRLRLSAEDSARLTAGKATVAARGDVKIDGNQIHLG